MKEVAKLAPAGPGDPRWLKGPQAANIVAGPVIGTDQCRLLTT